MISRLLVFNPEYICVSQSLGSSTHIKTKRANASPGSAPRCHSTFQSLAFQTCGLDHPTLSDSPSHQVLGQTSRTSCPTPTALFPATGGHVAFRPSQVLRRSGRLARSASKRQRLRCSFDGSRGIRDRPHLVGALLMGFQRLAWTAFGFGAEGSCQVVASKSSPICISSSKPTFSSVFAPHRTEAGTSLHGW